MRSALARRPRLFPPKENWPTSVPEADLPVHNSRLVHHLDACSHRAQSKRGGRGMTEAARENERPHIAAPRCPYCHEDVARGEPLQVCATCHAFHHRSCWGELGGCSACGVGREKNTAMR